MGLREQKKLELRERILTTALALFGSQGLPRTRVADIVGQLRISEATFFNYFPSKHAILDEAFARAVDAAVQRTLRSISTPTIAGLYYVAEELAGELAADQPVGRLLCWPDVGNRFVHLAPGALLLTYFGALQDRHLAREDLSDQLLAQAFLALVSVAIQHCDDTAGDDERALPQSLHRVVDVFVDGVRPQSRRRPRKRGASDA